MIQEREFNSTNNETMKISKTVLTAMAAAIACSMTAYAEGDGKKKGKRPGPEARKAILEKFDTNNDGELSEEEKAAMKKAMEERREAGKAKMLERFDTNKDGKLSEEERNAAREAMAKKRKEIRDAVLAEFDKNGNGKLDEDEREGVREWIKENYPDARPPHGKRPGKKGPGGKKKRGPGKKGGDATD